MSRFPEDPISVELDGVVHAVRFVATIAHGKGRRRIAVDVPPSLVCKIADALRGTAGLACATTASRPADAEPGRFNVGHAIWHVQNPDRVMPCIDGSTVIDATDEHALPAGATEEPTP